MVFGGFSVPDARVWHTRPFPDPGAFFGVITKFSKKSFPEIENSPVLLAISMKISAFLVTWGISITIGFPIQIGWGGWQLICCACAENWKSTRAKVNYIF